MKPTALPLALLLVLAAGCAGQQQASAPTTATAPPRGTALTPATAPGSTGSTVTPTTARATPTTATKAGTALPDVHTVDFATAVPGDACPGATAAIDAPVAFGDVTGDGHDEAAVTVKCNTGASTGYRHVYVYTADAGSPSRVRLLPEPTVDAALAQSGLTGSRTAGGTATIADAALHVRWMVWMPEDPNAGPSKVLTTHQRWAGDSWRDTAPATVAAWNPNG